jgi:hypothetical protein
MSLEDIANVSIDLATATVEEATFDVALIVAEHSEFTERVKYYASLAELVTEGFLTTSVVYKAASALLSVEPKPALFGVGRADTVGTNDATWAAALDAMRVYDDDWYGVILCDRTPADVAAVAAWVETNDKFFITATAVANVVDVSQATDSATIAYTVQNSNYFRTKVLYHSSADTLYPDATLMAETLRRPAGSYQMDYKTLPGVPTMKLTGTQKKNAKDKNVMIYLAIGTAGRTLYSKVGAGEWMDVIIFRDWLKSRIATRQAVLQLNNERIPYNNDGLSQIEQELYASLTEGSTVPNDGLDSFTITMPNADDISAAVKGTRVLSGVEFDGKIKNAVLVTTIRGTLTN